MINNHLLPAATFFCLILSSVWSLEDVKVSRVSSDVSGPRRQRQVSFPMEQPDSTSSGTDGGGGGGGGGRESRDEPLFESKEKFADWLLAGGDLSANFSDHSEYEGYDGWYNNMAHPDLGAVDSRLIRLLPSAYEDGTYAPSGAHRPGPLELSDGLMEGSPGRASATGKTAFLVFFGQQVVEEILDAQRAGCPPEYFNIKIPPKHRYSETLHHTVIPFLRTRYDTRSGQSPNNPRQQLNEITPWLDGGLIYGTSKGWSDALRSFKGGKLKASDDIRFGEFPAYNDINLPMANPPAPAGAPDDGKVRLQPVARFFRLGNPRGHENPFLLSMGVLWFRWHNFIADNLARVVSNASDEWLFNEARKWTIASYQHIVVDEWLPEWLGESLPDYNAYDPSIDPGVSHVFQSAAMRFGHTLVPAGGHKRKADCSQFEDIPGKGPQDHKVIRTCNSYWNPVKHLLEGGFEELILGLSAQPSEREDQRIVEDLRGNVFGPLEFTRRDLMAINVQRGRDHGLPDYLTARKTLLLQNHSKRYVNIKEVAADLWPTTHSNGELLETLENLYNKSVDNIDIWVGGLLETTPFQPGELFRTIIRDQFRRIRDGDRFWFESRANGLFSEKEVNRMKRLSISHIIRAVTSITEGQIQRNPFRLPHDKGNQLKQPQCKQKMEKSNYSCVINIVTQEKALCASLPPINGTLLEPCTEPKTFDYFRGSEGSYIAVFAFLGFFVMTCFLTLRVLVGLRQKASEDERKLRNRPKMRTFDENSAFAREWVESGEDLRDVELQFDNTKKCVVVKLFPENKEVRHIDLRSTRSLEIHATANGEQDLLSLRIPHEYDLVLKFDSFEERECFTAKMEIFLGIIGVGRERKEMNINELFTNVYTKQKRQFHLENFFKAIFSHAFDIETKEGKVNAKQAKDIIAMELTPHEFAEVLGLRSDSLFVQQMFGLVDKDNNGYISFREFLDMMIIFAKGSADQKAKLMFDMYDIDRSGKLSKADFSFMLRSMLELANQAVSSQRLETLISSMFEVAGLKNKQELTLSDFIRLLGDYREEFGYVELNLDVSNFQGIQQGANKRRSALVRAHDALFRSHSYFGDKPVAKSGVEDYFRRRKREKEPRFRVKVQEKKDEGSATTLVRFVDEYKWNIFWVFLFSALCLGIFLEKAYYYTYEREQGGLRQIAGLGVTLTRGSASVMMFCFSFILLTMCRNTITVLRETFLARFIPFDGAIFFHKYVAAIGLINSIMHSVGHAINFYHISTQTADDLTCLFREQYHATHQLPKFHYWCFMTITGLTGISLFMLITVIYVFAMHYSRRYVFNAFWATHNLYPLLYILMILHGMGRLIQSPIFYTYFTVPVVIFAVDRLISVSRKRVEISVVRAVLHPSDVTMLEFKRPQNFYYQSGQWTRIACLALNGSEYHPFTLASAPHEDNLQLFIRAVGPFTKNIRRTYDPNTLKGHAYPKLYLDGPYGEGHQDWFRYEVAVLIGGGIGVTPFASILKDIAFRSSINSKLVCKKVIFMWVTKSQRHFEWMVDIIRDVEEKNKDNLVTTHIFITQFFEKFDLRTTMLYICERHFQRISNRSLFTGLQAKTHFGRPDFVAFFESLQQVYPQVNRIGVFTCGPNPLSLGVQRGCEKLNRKDGPLFIHHYENF